MAVCLVWFSYVHTPLPHYSELVTRKRFLTPASKCDTESNGRIFDIAPKDDHVSPNVKTPYFSWVKPSVVCCYLGVHDALAHAV